MEDAHQHILELSPDDPEASLFAVFDGHGGAKVAQYSSIHLHKLLVKRPEYIQQNYPLALQQAFLECDRTMKVASELKDEMAGCTAVSVLIKGEQIWCANAGDSRCIGGVGGKAVALSKDHKPNNKKELERITNAGGFVEFNRVNGNLALSRALGDFIFKMNEQLPQVITLYVLWDLMFIVLIWFIFLHFLCIVRASNMLAHTVFRTPPPFKVDH